MTKKELVAAVADELGLARAAAEKTFDAVVNTIAEKILAGEDVAVPGFGTFKVAKRASREGINPLTKEKIIIPASKTVTFKPAKSLKDGLNK